MAKGITKFSQTREQLKEYFRKGKIPSEKNYADLIDSMIHKVDDGFSKDEENGLNIHAAGKSKSHVSFYSELNSPDPFFVIGKDQAEPSCLTLHPYNQTDGDTDRSVYFGIDGNVGLGKIADSELKLDVGGFVGMQGRMGTYRPGSRPADGKWHTIIDKLDNCQAFEIIARTGLKGKGKFAVLHGIALGVFGPRGSKIKKTSTCFGFFWNRINLRWTGTTHNYSLQIRTNSNYGDNVQIYYRITRLWDDHTFLDPANYYKK